MAEVILNHKFKNTAEIISAGTHPIIRSGMDPRSRNFLLNKGYNVKIHTPKKINKEIMIESDFIFCLDHMVLNKINTIFPKYRNKIKILNFQDPTCRLRDPFKMDNQAYLKVMEDIEKVCLGLNIA